MFHQSLSIDITFNHLRPAPMPLLMDPEFVVCISAHSVHLLLMGGGYCCQCFTSLSSIGS